MKLTNRDILSAKGGLEVLLGQKFPVLVSFRLAGLANKLNEHLKIIDEVRRGLIEKYGEAGERGQMVVREDSARFPQFVAEFEELMDLGTEIVFEKVKLPESLEIEPSALMALERFVFVEGV